MLNDSPSFRGEDPFTDVLHRIGRARPAEMWFGACAITGSGTPGAPERDTSMRSETIAVHAGYQDDPTTHAVAAVDDVICCDGCDRDLLVYYHVSRRTGAFLGFMVDAETAPSGGATR